MCGRFVQLPVVDFGQPGLADLAPGLAEIQPSFNLAPTQRASVILDRGPGRQVTRPGWGSLPFWAKAKGRQGSTINSRIETVVRRGDRGLRQACAAIAGAGWPVARGMQKKHPMKRAGMAGRRVRAAVPERHLTLGR